MVVEKTELPTKTGFQKDLIPIDPMILNPLNISNMRFSIILFAASFLLFASCNPASDSQSTSEGSTKVDMDQVKAEIQDLETAWATAQNAKDVNTLIAMYADDAISMPEGAPMLKGKAAIQARMEKEFAKDKEGHTNSFEVLEVFGDENFVTEIGTSTTKDAEGNVVSTGKYMVIWKKMDGKYLCYREIYNGDAPKEE
jgi:uncharacterized protein (TIGR02246 family)